MKVCIAKIILVAAIVTAFGADSASAQNARQWPQTVEQRLAAQQSTIDDLVTWHVAQQEQINATSGLLIEWNTSLQEQIVTLQVQLAAA